MPPGFCRFADRFPFLISILPGKLYRFRYRCETDFWQLYIFCPTDIHMGIHKRFYFSFFRFDVSLRTHHCSPFVFVVYVFSISANGQKFIRIKSAKNPLEIHFLSTKCWKLCDIYVFQRKKWYNTYKLKYKLGTKRENYVDIFVLCKFTYSGGYSRICAFVREKSAAREEFCLRLQDKAFMPVAKNLGLRTAPAQCYVEKMGPGIAYNFCFGSAAFCD